MKKAAFLLILMIPCMIFSACGKTGVPDKRIVDSISELRSNLYIAEENGYKASVITGYKENPFAVDGVSRSKKDFSVVSVEPPSGDLSADYTYTLKADGQTFSGKLLPHPFGKLLTADIGRKIEANQVTLTLGKDGQEQELTLPSQRGGDMIDWEEALCIGIDAHKKCVGGMYLSDKSFGAEVYVRFIGGESDFDDGFYWYVAFVNPEGVVCAALIDPVTKEITAKRN